MADEIQYEYISDYGINIYKLGKKYKRNPFYQSLKFYRICKRENVDIVSVWGIFPGLNSILAKLLLKFKVVNCSITSAYKLNNFDIIYILTKFGLLFSDKVISNSIAGLKSFRAESEKSSVIYNGINLDRSTKLLSKDEVRMLYDIKSDYNIVMVATFNNDKDYDLLLDIAKKIYELNSKIGFILVGDGNNYNRIKDRIEVEEIKNTILTGRTKDVESIVNYSDIGILLSPNGEGISNAIMEYMMLGKPVIATSIGGNVEIVEDNYNGFLIKNKSIEEAVDRIQYIFENKDIYEILSKNAENTIKEKFNINMMGQKFTSLVKELV